MKYYEVDFTLSPNNQDACDLMAALAGDVGFETFEETDNGIKGFIQQSLFDQKKLDLLILSFPIPDIQIKYKVSETEDKDWNEQWEQEGFDPIVIDTRLIIHDGKHLPTLTDLGVNPCSIEIDAQMAFGTGTHETTRMVCATLLTLPLSGWNVLDCGCGTGILGIVAMKLGANSCTAYDIDEWSVNNTRHNAVINHVDIEPILGDGSLLNSMTKSFDLIMANINRNILMADMPAMCQRMAPGAFMVLSGFYTDDIPLLITKADELGLTLTDQKENNGWACITLQKA